MAKLKPCLHCGNIFQGRRDAKTCSPRCRKGFQRTRLALADHAKKLGEEIRDEAARTVNDGLNDIARSIQPQQPAMAVADIPVAEPTDLSGLEPGDYPDYQPEGLINDVGSARPPELGPEVLSADTTVPAPTTPAAPIPTDSLPAEELIDSGGQAGQTFWADSPSPTQSIEWTQSQITPQPQAKRSKGLRQAFAGVVGLVIMIILLGGLVYLSGHKTQPGGISQEDTSQLQSVTVTQNTFKSIHINLDTYIDKGKQLIVSGKVQAVGDISTNQTLFASGGASSLNNSGLTINNVLVCTSAGCKSTTTINPAVANLNVADLAFLSSNQTFTAVNNFSNPGNSFVGNGSGLSNINASNITSGTLDDARLSANVALLDANQTFTGYNIFKNNIDSTTAFQIQNAAGASNLFVADTVNNRIAIGQATANYTVDVAGSVNGTTVYQNNNQVCDTSGNCAGLGGIIGGSGTPGRIAQFITSSTIGDSLLSQAGSTITVNGNEVVTGNLQATSITGFHPGYTVTVAASNSVNKDSATFVATGTNDQTTIQAAIDSLAGTGTVKLLEGTFNLSGSVVFDSGDSGVSLIGSGKNLTTITGSLAANTPYIKFDTPIGVTISDVMLSDFTIDGTPHAASNQLTWGLISQNDVGSLNNLDIQNLRITADDTLNTPITFTNDSGTNSYVRIEHNDIFFTPPGPFIGAGYAIQVRKNTQNLWINNNYVSQPVDGAYNAITVYGDSKYFHVNNNTVVGRGHSAIAVSPGSYGEISGNVVQGADSAGEAAIEVEWKAGHGGVDTSHHVDVADNVVYGNGNGWGIVIRQNDAGAPPPYFISVHGNTISDTSIGINVSEGTDISVYGNSYRNTTTNFSKGASVTLSDLQVESGAYIQGSVGIGLQPATAKLQVQGSSVSSGVITLTASSGASTFTTSASTTINTGDYVTPTTTTGQARVVTVGGTGSSFTVSPAFTANVTAETFTVQAPTTSLFNQAGNSNLVLQGATGNLGIGTSTPVAKAEFVGGISGCIPAATGCFAPTASTVKISNGDVYLPNGNSIYLGNAAGTSFQPILRRAATNNTEIQAGSGITVFELDTSNRVGIGANNTSPSTTDGTTGSIVLYNATAATGITSVTLRGGAGQGGQNILRVVDNPGNLLASVGANGAAFFQNSVNSTNAFQIQNASAASILNVDTSTTKNLLTNGDFEADGTTGWSVKNSAVLSRVTTQQWQGQGSLQVAAPGVLNSGAQYNFTFGVTTQYAVSLYAKVSSGSITDVNIGRQDNGSDIDCLTGQTLTTSWTKFTCTFTTGGTISGSNIYIKKTGAPGETFFVDGVQLEAGATVSAFNSGGVFQFGGLIDSPLAIQNRNNSTTAFQIQDSTGASNLFVADTVNNRIGIGTAAPTNQVTIQTAGGNVLVRPLLVRNTSSGTAADTQIAVENDAGSQVELGVTSTASTLYGTTGTVAYIRASSASSALDFIHGSAGGHFSWMYQNAEVLRLSDTASGSGTARLGLGEFDRLSKLTVKGGASFSATGTVSTSIGSATVTGTGSSFTKLGLGDRITIGAETKTITAIASDTSLTADTTYANNNAGATMTDIPSLFRLDDSSGGVKLVTSDQGNVGIGTTVPAAMLQVAGNVLFKNGSDTTSAFQVQNSAGNEILTTDTTNTQVVLGKASTLDGKLVYKSASGTGSIALVPANPGASNFTITLPAATGTVCLTSGNCAGVGGNGDILNNGNSFGTAVTLGTNDSNPFNFETNNQTQATIAVGGATTFKNSANSTTAFQIQNAAGSSNLLVADTTNSRVGIGVAPSHLFEVANGSNIDFRVSTTDSVDTYNLGLNSIAPRRITLASEEAANRQALVFSDGGPTDTIFGLASSLNSGSTWNPLFKINQSGATAFKNATDSTTAFQLQNAAGTSNLLIGDTTNTRIGIGKAPTLGTLDVNGSIYQSGNQVCDTSGNCVGTGGGGSIGGGGTLNKLAKFTGSGFTIGDSGITDDGSTLTLGENTLVKPSNSTTAFQIQNAAGTSNLLVADTTNTKIGIGIAPSSTGGLLQVGGNVGIINGTTAPELDIGGGTCNTGGFTCLSLYPSAVSGGYSVIQSIKSSGTSFGDIALNPNGGNVIVGSSSTPSAVLQVSNSGFGIASFKVTDTSASAIDVLTIDDIGASTFRNQTNSTTAFQLQNAAGSSNLFVADTTNTRIGIGASPANSLLTVGTNTTTAPGGITFGTDTNLYRSAVNRLTSDGDLTLGGGLQVAGGVGIVDGGLAGIDFQNGSNARRYNLGTGGTGHEYLYLTSTNAADSSRSDILYVAPAGTAGVNDSEIWLGESHFGGTGAKVSITPTATNQIGLLLQGTASQTADILRVKDSSNNILARISAGGDTYLGNGITAFLDGRLVSSTYVSGAKVHVGDAESLGYTSAQLNIVPTANSTVGQRIVARNSQTADLFQLQDGSLNTLSGFDSGGQLFLGRASGLTGNIKLFNSSGSGSISLTAANPGATNYTITLPAATGTVCLTSGNCAGVGGTGDILNNGNSFGAPVTIGTNDSNSLNFETNNNTQATIAVGGATTFKNSANSTAAFQIQNSAGTTTELAVDTTNNKLILGADTVASNSATGTTATTSGTGTNTTTVTLTGSAFTNGDVILIDNAGQDYYTRITAGGGTATLTVDPAVTFENARTVTKYVVQNIGATTSDYTTQANRFFQGYFLGGIVAGAGSTTYADGNIKSNTSLNISATNGVNIQNAAGTNILSVDAANQNVAVSNLSTPGTISLNGPDGGSILLRTAANSGAGAAMTFSGNEINDANRSEKVQGDGRATPDSSTGIWEATTNLNTNGGFESNTTGWAAYSSGTATLTRNTTTSKFGAAALKVVTGGAASAEGASTGTTGAIAVSASSAYTYSGWVKGSGMVQLCMNQYTSGHGFIRTDCNTAITLSSVWQRITLSLTSQSNAGFADLYVLTNATQAITFYADGIQLEQRPISTPYVETNGSSATRGISTVQAPSNLINATQSWAAFRLRTGFASSALANINGGAATPLFLLSDGTTNNYMFGFVQNNGGGTATFGLTSQVFGQASEERDSSSQTFNAGDSYTVVLAWISNQLKVSVNGGSFTTLTRSNGVPGGMSLLEIGELLNSRWLDSDILWTAMGTGTLSDTDVANIAKYGNSDPTITGLNTTAASSAPTFAWDAEGKGYSGTNNSPTLQSGITIDDVNIYHSANGGLTVQAGVNSTTAFQIQNAASGQLFNVDSTNANITLNGLNSGELQAWATNANNLPAARGVLNSTIANGYVYAIGGYSGGAQTTVYYAKLNADGSTAAFSTNANALPAGRRGANLVTANGFAYVIAGSSTNLPANAQSTVYYAKLNADGTTGAWQTSANALPNSLYLASSTMANGYVYVFGGQNTAGSGQTAVYYAKLNADGTTGAWQTSANALPGTTSGATSLIANGYAYVVGSGTAVYYAKLNADGSTGTFSTNANPLPGSRTIPSAVVANGYLYVIGGEGSTSYVYAKLNADGSTGTWTTGANSLAANRGDYQAVTANGYVYIVGGYDGSSNVSTVYYASTARVKIGGSLDLVGLGGQTLADPGDFSQGSTGGTLTAGNTTIVGSLQVAGQANFAQAISVGGLTVAGDAVLNANNSGELQAWATNANALPAIRRDHSTAIANGYVYVIGGYSTSYQSTVYYGKLNTDGSVGTWNTTTALPAVRGSASSVIANGYLYVIGGYDGSNAVSIVYYAKLNADGTVGAWSTATNALPAIRQNHTSVVANGYVYVIGGQDNSTPQSTVYYAKLNTDGSTGTWSTNANAITAARVEHSSVVANGYVYVIGGFNGGSQSTVYYAKLNADGSTGTWSTNANALPATRHKVSSVVANGYVYVIGGTNGGSAVATNYYAKLNSDGSTGTWTTNAANLPVSEGKVAAVVANGYVYALGGYDNTNSLGAVYYASTARVKIGGSLDLVGLSGQTLADPGDFSQGSTGGSLTAGNTKIIGSLEVQGQANFAQAISVGGLTVAGDTVLNGNNSGELQAWATNANALPAVRGGHGTVVANGYVYAIGGASGQFSPVQSTVYYAKLNSDGSTSTWTTNANALPAARTQSATVAANGYVYVIGGENSGLTPTTTVYYAKLNSDGSIGTWNTAANSLPAFREQAGAVVANGYVYIMGGLDEVPSVKTTVYYAKLNADGSVGAWATNANALTAGRQSPSSVVANGYVYVIGGNAGGVAQSTVYYAKLNADGSTGTWSTNANALTAARSAHTSVVANGYVYVLGGYNSGSQSAVYYAKLNADGSTGTWSTNANALTSVRYSAGTAIANGYVYEIGGLDGSNNPASTVYYASTPRVKIGGSLDLVGLGGQNLADGGDFSQGSTGGSLTAGNTNIVGSLQVAGQANFSQGVAVGGNLTGGGSAQFQNSTNSNVAFQVQNAAGTQLFNTDTVNSSVRVGNNSSPYAMQLPGVSGAYGSTPDAAANSITGDIDLVVRAAANNWSASPSQVLLAKWNTTGNQRSYMLALDATNKLQFFYSPDGTTVRSGGDSSALPFANGQAGWVRATYASGTGNISYYYASDSSATPTSWTAAGTSSVTAGSIFDSTAVVEIGTDIVGTNGFLPGTFYRGLIYNGIVGTLANDFDPLRAATTGSTTFTASTGETWTRNGTATFLANSSATFTASESNFNTNNAIFRNASNGNTAFQIQNAAAAQLFNVDSANARVGVDVTYAAMSAPTQNNTGTSTTGGTLTATTYYYKITAIDSAGGETTPSAEKSQVTTGSTSTVTLSWVPVSGASGYKIYRGTTALGGSNSEVYLTTTLGTVNGANLNFVDAGAITAGSATPPATNSAYTSTNNAASLLQLSVGGLGTPTGQVYVSGTQPTFVAQNTDSNLSSTAGIFVQGRYAYATSANNKVEIYDVSNPASPVFISKTGSGVGGRGIYVQGRYAYVAENGSNLDILDVSNPNSIVSMSSTGTIGTARAVFVQGRYAYVTNVNAGGNNFLIYDVSNPSSPSLVGVNADTNLNNPYSIYVQGRYAYIASRSSNKLVIYDVANPSKPTFLAQNSDSNLTGPISVYVQGRYAYVVGIGSNKLAVYDVSNPSTPTFVAQNSDSNLSSPTGVYLQGRYAYVTSSGNNKLVVYDVSNPVSPTFVAQNSDSNLNNPSQSANPLYVLGRYAYIANNGNNSLAVYDLGGTYTQQLEAGGAEVGTLAVNSDATFAGDASIQGGLNVGSALQVAGNAGITGGLNVQGTSILAGGSNLLATPGTPTVTPQGTTGATSYSYTVTALNAYGGETVASTAGSTASGNATLTASNFNQVSWSAVTGATAYRIYRTASAGAPSTTGYIGTTASTSFNDVGLLTAGNTSPTINTTGQLTVQGAALFQNTTNSTSAFQIQNAAGNNLFQVDAVNSNITLNGLNSGELQAWATNANALSDTRRFATSVTANGYTYVIGGRNQAGTYQSTVLYAKLNTDGSTSIWTTNANGLPATRSSGTSVVANGYVYYMGGLDSGGNPVSTVYYAKLNADGSTGTWSTSANALTAVRYRATSVVANGYVYVLGGNDGSTIATVYYAKLNTDGSTGTWTTSANSLPNSRYQHSSVVANGYVYVMGGDNGSGTGVTTVYYAKLNLDGSTGAFSTNANALPAGRLGQTSVVANGYVYIIGGNDGTNAQTTVYYAKLNLDGSTGTWSTNANALPAVRYWGSSIVANGYVYLFGGSDGTNMQSTVYYASTARLKFGGSLDLVGLGGQTLADGGDFSQGSTGGSLTAGNTTIVGSLQVAGQANFSQAISAGGLTIAGDAALNANNSGELQAWSTNANALPANRASAGYVTANGYVYVLGGYSSGTTAQTTVYYAKLNTDGSAGSFTTTTALPAARGNTASVVANGYVYVLGGYDGSVRQPTVYYAKLNTDGTIGAWITSASPIPTGLNAITSVVNNGYVYVIGGSTGSMVNTVYYAKLNADGSTGNWNTTTTITNVRGFHTSVVANGYLYVIGGFDNSNAVNTVYYAKFNADGTIGSWTTNANNLPAIRRNSSSIVANGYLYEIGGYDGTNRVTTVYYAKLNADGSTGAFSTNTNALPDNRSDTGTIIANGYVYQLGGIDNSGNNKSTVYYASTARLKFGGSLDLVGFGGQTLADGGDFSQGSTGGSLTAGNGNFVGSLQVAGQTNMSQSLSVAGALSVSGPVNFSGSVPTSVLGSVATGAAPHGIYIQGRYAYEVNEGGNNFKVYDVSNPASPSLISTRTTDTQPEAIYVQGRYAYVVNQSSGTLQIFDISNPASIPAAIGSISTGDTNPINVWVQGRYAYIIHNAGSNTLRSFDVSNPAHPVLLSSIGIGNTGRGLYIQGRYAYVTSGTAATLVVFDISNPASIPSAVGSVNTGGGPTSVYVQGRYAYVANNLSNSLQIYDISNPASIPAVVGTLSTGASTGPISVYVQGRYAYFVNNTSNTLQVADVSNPATPISVGTVSAGAAPNPYWITVQGRYGYIINANNNTLETFDLGGTYIQQLEAGGIETATLAVDANASFAGDLGLQGGLTVGQSVQVQGGLSVAPATDNLGGFQVADKLGNSILKVNTTTTDNLLVNGNFEESGTTNNTAGWAKYNSAETQFLTSVTNPAVGSRSLQVTTTAGGTVQGVQYAYQFKPNTTYTFSAYVALSTNNSGVVGGTAYAFGANVNGSDATCTSGNGGTGLTFNGTVTRFTCTFTTTTVGTTDFLFIRRAASDTNIRSIHTDGAMLEQGSVANNYAEPGLSLSNLVANPSFEGSSTNGWAVHNGTTSGPSVSSTYAQYGSNSLTAVTGATNNNGVQYQTSFLPNTQYSLSFWMRRDTSSATNINIGHADNGSDSDCLTSQTINTTWTQFNCSFTTGATIGSASNFYVKNNSAASNTIYIDGVTLVRSSSGLAFANNGSSIQVDNLLNGITLNSGNSGEIQPWKLNSNDLPALRATHTSVAANGYVYAIGGDNPLTTSQTTVYYAKVNADGSTGAWSTNANALPSGREHATAVVANGFVYVLGGAIAGGANQSTVYYARLNADGSTGVWQTNTWAIGQNQTTAAVLRYQAKSVVANGYIYLIGGRDATNSQSTVFYARLNVDGSTGPWTTTTALPAARQAHGAVVANGYVYVIGGNNGGTFQSTVYYAKLNSDGTVGAWSTNGNALPDIRVTFGTVVVNGYVYVIGGSNGNRLSTVFYAKLNGDGSTGSWQTSAYPEPETRDSSGIVAVNGYIYIIGGIDNPGVLKSNIWYSSTSRVLIGGSLDLVGLSGQFLNDSNGDISQGSVGGSLTAGNTKIVGGLEVLGQSSFSQAVTVQDGLSINTNKTGTVLSLDDGSLGNNLLNINYLNTNFGAAATAGAFIDRNSYFGEEFNVGQINSCTSTGSTSAIEAGWARGDMGNHAAGGCASNLTASADIGLGELNLSAKLGATTAGDQCVAASQNVANGVERLTATSTATSSNTANCVETLAATRTTSNKIYAAANLPVVTMKVKMSTLPASDNNARVYVGLSASDTANGAGAGMPGDGIFFSNCSTYSQTAPTGCSNTTWYGYVSSGNSSVTGSPVTCSVGSGSLTSQFSYLRIEVRTTTDIHFFADYNTANGIQESECGSGVSGTASASAMTAWLQTVYNTNAAQSVALDADYIRTWQDDNIPSAATNPATPAPDTAPDGQPITSAPPLTPDSADPNVAGSFFSFAANSNEDSVFNHNVFVHGTLYADKIKANQIEGLSIFTDQLASLQQQLAAEQTNINVPSSGNAPATAASPSGSTSNTSQGLVISGELSASGGVIFRSPAGQVIFSLDSSTQQITINGGLNLNGHLVTGNQSGATTAEAGAAAACDNTSAPDVQISGNDTAGNLTITTADGNCLAGVLATVHFANSYSSSPVIVLTPKGSNGAGLKYYYDSSNGSFNLITGTAPAAGTTYIFSYHILQ